MENFIIIGVLAIILFLGARSAIKHFKGEGGCCGGGSSEPPSKKKLKKKTVLISLETEVSDDVIRTAIEKRGYDVIEIR